MEDNKKEVYYELYCEKCIYGDRKETDDPCNDCLAYPYNINSHKPVLFKEKEDAEKDKG